MVFHFIIVLMIKQDKQIVPNLLIIIEYLICDVEFYFWLHDKMLKLDKNIFFCSQKYLKSITIKYDK